MFQLLNTRTGAIVGTYLTKARARLARDQRDNAYGAYVHRIVDLSDLRASPIL